MRISDNISAVRDEIALTAGRAGVKAEDIILVAASKTMPAAAVREAVLAGVDAVGENRVQELLEKHGEGAYDGVPLHFIGHLQKNKVNKVVGTASLIQSADSKELIELISARAVQLGVIQEILIEVNIAGEASKSGFGGDELPGVLEFCAPLSGVRVSGLMAIPPVSSKSRSNRACFGRMYKLFVDIAAKKYDNVSMDFLSMGMSGDFAEAIMEGANMVRVGSAIFGERK